MKILFIAGGTLGGNAAFIRAASLGGALRQMGHDPCFCLTEADDTRALLKRNGVSDRCTWVPTRNPLSFALRAPEFYDIDVLHLIDASLAGELMGIRLRRRAIHVISDWDEWLSRVPSGPLLRWKRLCLEFLARKISSGFVFSSAYLQEAYRPFLGDNVPTTYIPYGLAPGAAITADIAGGPLRQGRRYALYVGSLHEAYREDLRQLPLLAHACLALNLDLVVVGGGGERKWLEPELNRILPDGRVVFTGFLSDCDTFAGQPSIAVCFLPLQDNLQNRCRCPNKIFHYINGRKPIVTNRVGEPASLLGSLASYYEYGDVVSLTAAIRRATCDTVSYDIDNFTWTRRASNYIQFLDEHFNSLAGSRTQ